MTRDELARAMRGTRAEIEQLKKIPGWEENKNLQRRLRELQYLQLWCMEQYERLGGRLNEIIEV